MLVNCVRQWPLKFATCGDPQVHLILNGTGKYNFYNFVVLELYP